MARKGAVRNRQRQAREQSWRGHLGGWSRSGLSQAAYCRRHGLAPADFSWWKHELARRDGRPLVTAGRAAGGQCGGRRGQAAESAVAPAFVPVRFSAPSLACPFEVLLRNGQRIQVAAHFEPEGLRRLVAVLESSRGAC